MIQDQDPIIEMVKQHPHLSGEEKQAVLTRIEDIEKKLGLVEFRLERTEKVKKTLSVLLDESIKDLERKKQVIENVNKSLLVQNRELEIEAALERVRSSAMTMHTSEGLLEVIHALREQMAELGEKELEAIVIHFYKEKNEEFEAWYSYRHTSDPNGKIIHGNVLVNWTKTERACRDKEKYYSTETDYTIVADYKMLKEWYEYLELVVPEVVKYDETGKILIPDSLYYNYSKFSSGAMLLITNNEASDDSKHLLKRSAEVFNLAYTRFLDLQKAEAQAMQAQLDLIQIQTEKKRAEDALSELQATQKQLIQSEKMASLGELTAGIAHEIQNPLNFVNNFSEVSSELLDEMKEVIEAGDLDEIKLLAGDLKQNLDKINHHGQRASNIVKGMLQHSRTSSGVKEPTDINALADEYLRLAYHGFRAKEKSFNAEFKTDLDPSLPKVNVIGQDIGRVLLNLINNAFYAVIQKKNQMGDSYEPTVSVSTKLSPAGGGKGHSRQVFGINS